MTATARIPVEEHGYAGEPEDDGTASFAPINFLDLARENPQRGPAVIDGIVREGEVGTLIGGSKTRKSWLVAALIAAALSGGEWMGHAVTKCRVLVLDSELTRATILWRVGKVLDALGVPVSAAAALDIYDLRGRTKDAGRAIAWARAQGPRYYGLIVLDPLYTLYPPDPRFSENDNAAMRRLFDDIITFAGETQAAVLAIHHLSKGSQAEKSLTDLGAGAGAIARAGDAHIALRPHRERDCVVMDGVVRDFPESPATCWRFSFPLYRLAPELDPLDLAGGKPRKKTGTAEFLAGGKAAKPEPLTLDEFIGQYLSAEPRELAFLAAQGRPNGLKPKTVAQLAAEAVAVGKAFRWDGTPGKPARFGTVAPPENDQKQAKNNSGNSVIKKRGRKPTKPAPALIGSGA